MLTNVHVTGCNQYGTPWADGTASISQCAINPEETYVYRFQVDKVTHFLIIPQISLSRIMQPHLHLLYLFAFT